MSPSARTNQIDTCAPVTLLFGDAEVLKDRALEQIVAARLETEEAGTGLSILEGTEAQIEDIVAELTGLSLLASERIVVIKRVDAMAADNQRRLADTLERLPEGVQVIMTTGEATRSGQPPVVAQLAKASKKLGQVRKLSSPYEKKLPQWTVQEAQRLGKNISAQAAEQLIELTGGSIDRIVAELEKIALYIGDTEVIDEAAVAAVTSVSLQATNFQLADAIGNRDVPAALHALSILLPPTAGQGAGLPLVGMIARQLRLIWQTRVAARAGTRIDRGQQVSEELADKFPQRHNIVEAVGNRDWLARKLTAMARNFTDAQLAQGLARVYETDLMLKGQAEEQIDERVALETLIVELCQL